MNEKSLKYRLRSGQLTLGSWIAIDNEMVAEIMARQGFDWLTIDIEHSAVDLGMVQRLVRTIELNGCVPLVRVGENNANLIKRVMDTGAHGVIVSMVNTAEDARRAVESVKYPPIGRRGVGLSRAQGYGFNFEGYKKWLKKESVVIVQIEHVKAIENLEEILSTPGVDGSIIGPYDLSGSLGIPGEFADIRVKSLISRYEMISKNMGKAMGSHVVHPDIKKVNGLVKKGYTILAVGLDSIYLGLKCGEVLKGIKDEAIGRS